MWKAFLIVVVFLSLTSVKRALVVIKDFCCFRVRDTRRLGILSVTFLVELVAIIVADVYVDLGFSDKRKENVNRHMNYVDIIFVIFWGGFNIFITPSKMILLQACGSVIVGEFCSMHSLKNLFGMYMKKFIQTLNCL